jgi:hypothetical protein
MALTVKSCVILSDDCTSIYFFDKTGIYNASTNPTGYGAPNPAIGDFASATLSVTIAGATTPIVVNVFADLPSNNVDAAYELTAAACGLTVFPDGLTRVTYTIVTKIDVTYTTTQLFLVDCDIECCIEKKKLEIAKDPDSCGCGCGDKKILNMLYLEALLEAAQAATCCGDVKSVNDIVSILKTKCSSTNCSNC